MTSTLEIGRQARMRPIEEIARQMGIDRRYLTHFGEHIAKIDLESLAALQDRPRARYVVVTALTPTPYGEGKTTTTLGLGEAMQHIGHSATVSIRQGSMGPTFGIKGAAAGGGHSQAVPFEPLALHFTGDTHAVTAAHDLLAAIVDNHLHQGNDRGLDPHGITWRRVLDVDDRALRNIVVGLGDAKDGVPRQTGFDISAASEVMAVLALATSVQDMRERIGRIVVGYTKNGEPVTAEDLH
ncbi:MAG: formate--tetrahydrofolate ligase, partial [Acidimicrobiales bacterium]